MKNFLRKWWISIINYFLNFFVNYFIWSMIFHVHMNYCIETDMLYHFMYNILYYTEQPNSNAIFQCRCISLNWTTLNRNSCVMTMKYIYRFSIVLLGYHVGFWYGNFWKILQNNVFLFFLFLYLGSIWLKIIIQNLTCNQGNEKSSC